MAGFGDILGKGSIAEQFLIWGVLQQLTGAGMAPFLQSLENEVWKLDPSLPVPPGILAELSNRGLIDDASAANQAEESGVGGAQFANLKKANIQAPDLGTAIAAYQRQLIDQGGGDSPDASLYGALKDLRVDPSWWPIVKALAVDWPSPADVMNALLEGQIDRATALDWYLKGGGNPDWFDNDFNSKGEAPTPNMLGDMVHRGLIGLDGEGPAVTSFHQGFLEGPWRNKWETPMRGLIEYIPPPRTITALVHEGAVTDAQALAWFQDTGMSAATAAVYLKSAHSTKTAAAKALTVSNIEALYKNKLITESTATADLVALGYPADQATLLLKLATLNNTTSHVNAAVTKVRTLYTQRKITADTAKKSLVALAVPDDQTTALLEIWDIELAANVKQLTEAQVVDAWDYGAMSDTEALGNLEAIGYTPYDSWVLLSIKNKGALPNKPAKTETSGGILP